ncbi:hypothetical protein [Brevibacillus reuszeri]|uniref:hypothetical protein n=1 Tax=Brevibacillus reuszeri TaxID=54915 RepID=UPI003D198711
MEQIQLNIFDLVQEPLPDVQAPQDHTLNGFYYERSADKFVSLVLGTKHYEVSPKECEFPKEWQKRVMKERAI